MATNVQPANKVQQTGVSGKVFLGIVAVALSAMFGASFLLDPNRNIGEYMTSFVSYLQSGGLKFAYFGVLAVTLNAVWFYFVMDMRKVKELLDALDQRYNMSYAYTVAGWIGVAFQIAVLAPGDTLALYLFESLNKGAVVLALTTIIVGFVAVVVMKAKSMDDVRDWTTNPNVNQQVFVLFVLINAVTGVWMTHTKWW